MKQRLVAATALLICASVWSGMALAQKPDSAAEIGTGAGALRIAGHIARRGEATSGQIAPLGLCIAGTEIRAGADSKPGGRAMLVGGPARDSGKPNHVYLYAPSKAYRLRNSGAEILVGKYSNGDTMPLNLRATGLGATDTTIELQGSPVMTMRADAQASAEIEVIGQSGTYVPLDIFFQGTTLLIQGSVGIFAGATITGREDYPLTFKMLKGVGLTYLCGTGTIKTSDGTSYELGSGDTVSTWLSLLDSKDALLREGAAQSLGWLCKSAPDRQKCVPALVKALSDSAMEVRRDAAESLGKIGDAGALDGLRPLTSADKESSDWVREVAQEAITLLEKPAGQKP